ASVSVKDARNGLLAEYYGAAGRAYPAYVSLVLLPAMVRACRSNLPGLIRVAALLLVLGSVAIGASLLFPVFPPALDSVEFVINYTAVLCFVIGLALIWLAKLRSGLNEPGKKTSTAK
ncbi:hypothetical protein DAD99_04545, partial [Pseudarthrobacter sp. AB1]|nr:hypothetical protein [Pseudarthrobacter sp. AB1]